MKEFGFSETVIEKMNAQVAALWLGSLPCVFLFILFGLDKSLAGAFFVWAGVALVSGTAAAIGNHRTSRTFRTGKLHIHDEKISRSFGKRQRLAFWGDITDVKVVKNVRGNVRSISLYGKSMPCFRIYGFHEMEAVLSLVKERVPATAHLRQIRFRLNWEHPLVFVGLGRLSILIVFCALTLMCRLMQIL